ncbi:hypothetical protein [Pantoea sp. At-9b]|uniref:hypothetical protein n=1 Tax=Pantoea sp. (strain At-9b) TaxID=592316 RepID=UPI0001B3F4B9|nr:hypothetical protein [Pantoea sp. At-9b]ADU72313.1 hypothetical protein Pat9b_5024 [Pantoea sp. At-9b]
MERCPKCGRWRGEPKPVAVGDKVAFTFQHTSPSINKLCGRIGKLLLIKENGYSVIYRGKVYHSDEVAHIDDPTPLTLAFNGVCDCNEELIK